MGFNFRKFLEELTNTMHDENVSNGRRLFYTANEELSISAHASLVAKNVDKTAYNILKQYKSNPSIILKYIEAKGTRVVYCKPLLHILKFLGYSEGFIPKHYGLKALILNIVLSIFAKEKFKFSATFEDRFIICKKDLSTYFIAYQLHHWIAYKSKLPGYDSKTQHIFKTAMSTKVSFAGLSMQELISVKDAIERDRQAIDFVTDFVREQIGAKECLENILQGEKVKI